MTIELTGEGGKGDSPRPTSVSRDVKDLRYTLAFGSEEEKSEARIKLIEVGVIRDDTKNMEE